MFSSGQTHAPLPFSVGKRRMIAPKMSLGAFRSRLHPPTRGVKLVYDAGFSFFLVLPRALFPVSPSGAPTNNGSPHRSDSAAGSLRR